MLSTWYVVWKRYSYSLTGENRRKIVHWVEIESAQKDHFILGNHIGCMNKSKVLRPWELFEDLLFALGFLSCITMAVHGGKVSWTALICFHCYVTHMHIALQVTLPIISLEFQNCIPNSTSKQIYYLSISILFKGKKNNNTQASIHFVLIMLVNNITTYIVTQDRNLEIILESFISFISPTTSLLQVWNSNGF